MQRDWIKVFIASFFEVLWVIGLKHSYNVWTWLGTAVCILISFYGLIMAGKRLPSGTVYAVFTGLGTAGTVIAGILFFEEPVETIKLLFIAILLVGVMGLKRIETEKGKGGES